MEVALTSSSSTPSHKTVKAIPVAASDSPPPPNHSRKRRKICLCSCTVLLLPIVVLLILFLTVFKAKDPTTTVNSFSIKNLNSDLDIARLRVDLNLTLAIDLSIKNNNMVGFKYRNSTAALNYRGTQIGAIDLPADEIPSDRTKRMNITLTVMVDRVLSETQQLISDVVAGVLPMNTYTKISGKVRILGIFKVHVKATSSCDFNVKISTASVTDQSCTNKAKL
ncbi:uncharacterized protein LOC133819995 [Humulus lupulus]|uniref:uncharacterized protein LOC133819995 n=1 Tax=Humulus lupulus TaxID=3486 RepID=UPI002B40483E|nr:uncharacterized protein LOC133819995 [Humulus lupulus]